MLAIRRPWRPVCYIAVLLAGGSLLFPALWLTAVTMLIRPNADTRGAAPADRASVYAERDPVALT